MTDKMSDELLGTLRWLAEKHITREYRTHTIGEHEARQILAALFGGGWQTIDTLPNTGEVVLFYLTGKRPCMNRADDFHRGWAHWLEGATHWRYLPEPPPKDGA